MAAVSRFTLGRKCLSGTLEVNWSAALGDLTRARSCTTLLRPGPLASPAPEICDEVSGLMRRCGCPAEFGGAGVERGRAVRPRLGAAAQDGAGTRPAGADRAAGGRGLASQRSPPTTSTHTVGKWRERFARLRTDGLLDEPRPGAPRRIGDERVAELVGRTHSTRPDGATPWSLRTMARASGLSVDGGRVWRAFGAAAAPGGDLQALDRPPVCREGPRHRRALRCAPRPCSGALRGREEPSAGTRPHATAAALAAGPGGAADPRLCPPRWHEPFTALD